MCHETHFPNPCTLWTQNAFPKISRAAVRPLCLLGPLLSASKESLLIVPIDSQPCLIYCCMIYGAAALSGAGWQAGSCPVLALATPPEKRRKGEKEMRCAYKEAFSAQQLEKTDCLLGETLWHLLIPSNSSNEGSSQKKSLKWRCEHAQWKTRGCTPHLVHANSKS